MTSVPGMIRRGRTLVVLVSLAVALPVLRAATVDLSSLGRAEPVARGVDLYRLSDPSLLSPPGAVAVQLLRIDPGRVRIGLALAQDTVLGLETVPSMADRSKALAAINSGFFLPTGEPAGLLKVHGEVVSDVASHRGAVAIRQGRFGRGVRLLFDQVRAHVDIDVGRGRARRTLRADGIDTERRPEGLVLFTPSFWTDTRTPCDGGTELILDGPPLMVAERRDDVCTSAIPTGGAVLAAGPKVPADTIAAIVPGSKVRTRVVYETLNGTRPSDWDAARDIVGGVGLLEVGGRMLSNWEPEQPRAGFTTERHPRTVIGTAGDGRIWLITVDGRKPEVSLGMSFAELQGLIRRVGLVDALNLDGGGSTTMVVQGTVMNHPSDATGVRKVSDAIVVTPR
jgi:hypothetical protein